MYKFEFLIKLKAVTSTNTLSHVLYKDRITNQKDVENLGRKYSRFREEE